MPLGLRKKAGLIGLGIIGTRVAANMRRRGFRTFVWNRSPRQEPNFLASPAEIADAAKIIHLFVSDENAVRECIEPLLSVVSKHHILLNHATIGPECSREIASQVGKAGASYLEAPFTGSRDAAERGELIYYIGGDASVLEKARPQLEASSKAIVHIGEIGQAAVVKLSTNMISAVSVQVLLEALNLNRKAGVPLDKFAEALSLNACNSGTITMKIAKMLQGNYEPHFSLKHMLKDMRYALQTAATHRVELPATNVATATLLASLQAGRGDMDFSAIALQHDFTPPAKEQPQEELPKAENDKGVAVASLADEEDNS